MSKPVPRIERFTLPDGYRTSVRVWDAPAAAARAVFVHGIVSHGGWYLSSCAHLNQAGYEVHFLERRGSGLNLVGRGDVDRWQTWLADVESYLASLAGTLPVVLLGISWGGKLAAAVARHRPELVAGFGMICPGLFAYQQANRFQRLVLQLARTCGMGSLRVTIPLQDPALFTESPRWQEYLRCDPFLLRKVTIRFATEDLKLNRYAAEAPGAIRTPALLTLAGRDRICDNRRTEQFFRRLASAEKTLLEYPDAAHTLEFEADPRPYFDDLADWVGRITAEGR